MHREDPENAVAEAKFAFIQGGKRPVDRDGRQAKSEYRFREDGEMLKYLEDSDDEKVGMTDLQERLEISEKSASGPAGDERKQPASFSKFSGKEKESYVLPVWPGGTRSYKVWWSWKEGVEVRGRWCKY